MIDCDWHWVAGDPTLLIQPSRSLTNEISALTRPLGSGRCSHVVPRSIERKRTLPPTNAHTTSRDGALTCAGAGSGIGVFVNEAVVALGETLGVAVGLLDGVALVVAVAVGDVATPPGWSRRFRY